MQREEKKRATGMPAGGGINSRLGRAQKRSTERGRAARYKGRKLNRGIKIKLGLIKWERWSNAELIRRDRHVDGSSSLSRFEGILVLFEHRLEKNEAKSTDEAKDVNGRKEEGERERERRTQPSSSYTDRV